MFIDFSKSLLCIDHDRPKGKQEKRQTFQQSRLFIIFLNDYLSEASVIDSKYIKMTGLQDFY